MAPRARAIIPVCIGAVAVIVGAAMVFRPALLDTLDATDNHGLHELLPQAIGIVIQLVGAAMIWAGLSVWRNPAPAGSDTT